MAENATHNLHNLLTLRGALVRDPADVVALPRRGHRRCSPTRPTWPSPRTTGRPGATTGSSTYLAQQRDLYAYLHDQTLRLLNQGYTGIEIAE